MIEFKEKIEFEDNCWDLDHNFERDFPDVATEVFSKTKTITIYK